MHNEKRLPACGSWHGAAVTEGFYRRHFPIEQTYVETCKPLIPPVWLRQTTPTMARGALVRCLDFHPVTIPGFGGAVTIC